MANLWITELRTMPIDCNGKTVEAALLPAITTQKVTISGTSAQSAALNADTKFVRVMADANCCILAAADPTATTSNLPLTAEGAEYFGVFAGQKIAAITR